MQMINSFDSSLTLVNNSKDSFPVKPRSQNSFLIKDYQFRYTESKHKIQSKSRFNAKTGNFYQYKARKKKGITFKSGIETRTPTIHGAKRKQQKQSGEKQGDGEKQHEEAFTPNKPRDPFETPTTTTKTTTRRSIPPPLRGIAESFSSGAEAVAVILGFTHGRKHQLKVSAKERSPTF